MDGHFIFIVLIWIVLGVVCASIWQGKGGSYAAGFAFGVLLGLIGLVIVLVAKPDSRRSGTRGSDRECPYCKSSIRADASVCPHCQHASDPWRKIRETWTARDAAGATFWLDTKAAAWYPVRTTSVCPNCGRTMTDDESICSGCKKKSSRRLNVSELTGSGSGPTATPLPPMPEFPSSTRALPPDPAGNAS